MDQAWLKRLVDRDPGSCMLTDYVRMTRLLSGLSESGWMKLARKAAELKQNQELQSSVLHNPDVVSFLDLLKNLDDDEKIIVLDVVRQGLFPDQPGVPLFKAASTDPKEHPKVAVKKAREEIKTLERDLRPVAVTVQDREDPVWADGIRFDPDTFLWAVCGVPKSRAPETKTEVEENDPSAISAVADPEVPVVTPQPCVVQKTSSGFPTFQGPETCVKVEEGVLEEPAVASVPSRSGVALADPSGDGGERKVRRPVTPERVVKTGRDVAIHETSSSTPPDNVSEREQSLRWLLRVFVDDSLLCTFTRSTSESLTVSDLLKDIGGQYPELCFRGVTLVNAKGVQITDGEDLRVRYPLGASFSVTLRLDTLLQHCQRDRLMQRFPGFSPFEVTAPQCAEIETIEETLVWSVNVLLDDDKLETKKYELPFNALGKALKQAIRSDFQDLMAKSLGVLSVNNQGVPNDVALKESLDPGQPFLFKFRKKQIVGAGDFARWLERYPELKEKNQPQVLGRPQTFLFSVYIDDMLATSASIDFHTDGTVGEFSSAVLRGLSGVLSKLSAKVQLAVSEEWLCNDERLVDCLRPDDELDLRICLKAHEVTEVVPHERLPLLFPAAPLKDLNRTFGGSFVDPSFGDVDPKPKKRPVLKSEAADPNESDVRASHGSCGAKKPRVDARRVQFVVWQAIGTLSESQNRNYSLLVKELNHVAGGYRPYAFAWVVVRKNTDPIQLYGDHFAQVMFSLAGAFRLVLHESANWFLKAEKDVEWSEESRTLTFFLEVIEERDTKSEPVAKSRSRHHEDTDPGRERSRRRRRHGGKDTSRSTRSQEKTADPGGTMTWTKYPQDTQASTSPQKEDGDAAWLRDFVQLLREAMRVNLPLGGHCGFTVTSFPLVVQCHGLDLVRNGVVYIVRDEATDFFLCPHCAHFGPSSDPCLCTSCFQDPRDFRLPPAPLEGEHADEEIFANYVPRPNRVLRDAGRITLELTIVSCWFDFVWFVEILNFGEGFLMIEDGIWKPVPGAEVVFFQGHVVGRLYGKPLLVCPPKDSPGALVRRPKVHDEIRILDFPR